MSLFASKLEGESWREVVERHGEKYGCREEALAYFDAEIARGIVEMDAAYNALYEWDLLEFRP